jgi:hypothetical protein
VRITRGDADSTPRTPAARSRSRSNAILQITLLFLACALGFFVHQQGLYRPLATLAVSLVRQPAFTIAALFHRSDLPTLYVGIKFKNYQLLLDKREQALQLGANVASDQDYVPATVYLANSTSTVQVRLPAGPATELSGERWPFEVVIEGNATLLDMHHFALAPADATALSAWGYLETLQREGLLAPRYRLVRLVLDGSPRGLYTLEELPGTESLGRPGNSVVYFDSSAYWEAWAGLGNAPPDSGFQYAQAAANCPTADAACQEAVQALRALQAGELAPSEALDVDKMGAFLALTTLWRGNADLDWRTLRLAYNPATARFEPIGAGASSLPVFPLPETIIDDPQVQVAYARALARYSRPEYLTQLQADLGDDFQMLQRDSWIELGGVGSPWPTLEAHQATMRRQLAPARTLLANIETADNTTLVLRLANVQPFPVEITGLDVGEDALLAIDPAWVDASDRALLVDEAGAVVLRAAVASAPRALHLRVPLEALPTGHEWDWLTADQIRVVTRLYRLEGQEIVVAAQPDVPGGGGP